MPIDVTQRESPGWWLDKLQARRVVTSPPKMSRHARLELLWRYLIGDCPLPDVAESFRPATQEFMRLSRNQYALLICEALLHRVRFLGLRTAQDQDSNGDDVARDIATASGFATVAADALLYMFGLGEGYLMVHPPGDDDENPVFTAQSPRDVITAQDPLRSWKTRAGLLQLRDEDREVDQLFVYTPGRVDVASRRIDALGSVPDFTPETWDWDEELSGAYPSGLGLEKVVPIVRFQNRLNMGEFEPHLDLLNRINGQIGDRLWIAKMQAARQRALIGDLDDTDPETGQDIDYDDLLAADPGAVWRLPSGVTLWESGSLDLTPVLSAVKDDVRELSAVTHTSLPVLSPDAAGGSAEGASLQRESGVFKADGRVARATPPMLQAWRTAFLFAGERERATGFMQAMWAPTERFSLAQRGSAAVQAENSKVPTRSIWSDIWQFDPDTVARMESERNADLLFQLTGQGQSTPVAPTEQPQPVTVDG